MVAFMRSMKFPPLHKEFGGVGAKHPSPFFARSTIVKKSGSHSSYKQSSYRSGGGGQSGSSAKVHSPAGSGSRPGGSKYPIGSSAPSNAQKIRP
jgi:hypothetical protein